MGLYFQNPTEEKDRGFNWSSWLSETGDTIASSTWTATPSGLTLSNQTFSTTKTSVRISGGTDGATYTVKNNIVTTSGQKSDETHTVLVGNEY